MARMGQVTKEAAELNDARSSLVRELERAVGTPSSAEYLMQRLERLIDAKIEMSKSGY